MDVQLLELFMLSLSDVNVSTFVDVLQNYILQEILPFLIKVRLMGGPNQYTGRLEIYHDLHGWATVCDDLFGDVGARVACRMLGYTGGEFLWPNFGEGNGSIGLDNVDCWGDEESLWDCEHNDWGENDCTHAEDASIRCGERRVIRGEMIIHRSPTLPFL